MTDPVLKKNIQQALKQSRNFVLAVKGSDVALFVSKKPIQPAMEKEIKARVKASSTITGVCTGDDGSLAFKSTDSFPPCGPKLKAFIKAETNLTVDPTLETVASLEAVDEDLELPETTGAKPPIDVDARRHAEIDGQVDKMRAFVASFDTKHAEFEAAYQLVNAKKGTARKAESAARKELKTAQAATPKDDARIAELTTIIADANKVLDDWSEARGKIQEHSDLKVRYEAAIAFAETEKNFETVYEALQPGRIKAIDAVQAKMEQVFAATNRSLAILGRTKQTFEDESSWAKTHPGEEGRVLAENDWSMAVNDAFMKAGLNQKADFAMITKFKKDVLDKIKSLTLNPEGRTIAELKTELRDFVRAEADPALFTGGSHNDGFAVSMVELEQLLDDGYVMMEHDPDAQGKKVDDLTKEQVMVPSGQGQKIKADLAGSVEEREARKKIQRKKVNDNFVKLVKRSDKTIKESPKALKVLRGIKQAMDENRWDDADKALSALETALNPS